MPELPEVETMRRGILSVVGMRIRDCDRPPCSRRPIQFTPEFPLLRDLVSGQTITDVTRRGKRLILHLGDRSLVIIEPRMTGLVLLADPPTADHLRLRMVLEHAAAPVSAAAGTPSAELLFWDRRGLGTVRWLSADQAQRWLEDSCIGPDALRIDAPTLRQRLGTSRRPIKVALLDQRALSGVGNLYASEILHLAGIDPRAACSSLTAPQWVRVQRAMLAVLRAAIEHEGSTLRDGTYRNALNEAGGYQNHHRVYDRAGSTCPRCAEGPIHRIVQSQRSTFFCPRCQRRRGQHPLVETFVV